MFFVGVALSALLSVGATPPAALAPAGEPPPPVTAAPTVEVSAAVHHDVSPPLRDIAPKPHPAGPREIPKYKLPTRPTGVRAADPALQSSVVATAAPTAGVNFDGVGSGFSGPAGAFTVTSAPPDTNGDVGPNHYVQTVNESFAIFNKIGTAVFGPVAINTLWSGFGGGCETNNDGDPIVLYDRIADRWVISQFSVTTTPFLECVAMSKTPDPTGSYFRYSFSPGANFPDYPKLGVWPDAYYVTFNMFNSTGTSFQGAKVCAYDRAKMLAGLAATQQCFQLSSTFGGLLPSSLDGSTLPPIGSPNYVVAEDLANTSTLLQYWKFHVDWTTPANTTFTGPTSLTVASYTISCAGGTCIPQGGTTQKLDSLADRLMHRLAYRNFGDHESLVVNHTIEVGSGSTLQSGVRWYELRVASGNLTVFQQGTYAPADSNWRWMGSVAMDQAGNIGLGYSVSGSAIHPQIHYTGRLAGDAAGTMTQGENVLINGGGSQTPTLNRWGDYSRIAVDPADDCTFWYTNEYLKADGSFNWSTRIGSFKLPGCPKASPKLTTLATPTATVGGTIQDTATLAGATPTAGGTITFNLYGPNDASCVMTPTPGGTATVNGNGPYNSSPVTVSQAGTYRWIASYSGDAANNPAATKCNDPGETSMVNKASPLLSTLATPTATVGGTIQDTATLAGATPTAGGTITFNLYGPNDASCVMTPTPAGARTVSGNGLYNSSPVTVTQAGTYRWIAAYSGDANNNAATTTCNDRGETSTVTAGSPATLVLTPLVATDTVGDNHTVTATVRDAFSNPTPGITVRFTVIGAAATFSTPASGSATTNTAGQATFTFTAALPGVNGIHAFADTNNNSTQDGGEPFGDATKTWVLPVTTALCEILITDGGHITAINGDLGTFGGVARSDAAGNASGNEQYQDHGGPTQAPINVKAINILAITCTADFKTAQVFGNATINGAGSFPFRIRMTDNGDPGVGQDVYGIIISSGYVSGDKILEGGNIQIHKLP